MSDKRIIFNIDTDEPETVHGCSETDRSARPERDRSQLFDFTFSAPKSVSILALLNRPTGTPR